MRIFAIIICALMVFTASTAFAEKWKGLDETVVEKVAEEYGRSAVEPVINTDQGDLLLFVFLLAGVIGGFVAGYFYRKLMAEAPKNNETENMNARH